MNIMEIEDNTTKNEQDLDAIQLSATQDAPKHAEHNKSSITASQSQEPPQISAIIQCWVDRSLTFVSNASNETLGACVVGLGASTYLVLGRVGLVIIGVVGGIALHATWENSALAPGQDGQSSNVETKRRRELALETVQRAFRWQDRRSETPSQHEEHGRLTDTDLSPSQGKRLDFSEFGPETASALEKFTTAVIRDYVRWWYSPILPGEESFPSACRQTLTSFILSLSGHISRKRPTEIFLNFSVNSSSILIALFAELSAAIGASPNSDAATAIAAYTELKPDSSLAQMIDDRARERKLSLVAEDILQNYLDSKAYNFPPVRVFLHQILAKLVLATTLEACSKPDWINGWIVHLLEDGEPEIMQAIDAGVENAAQNASGQSPDVQKTSRISATRELSDQKRQVSRAEEAMEEALQEARRLTQMIADDEAKKAQAQADVLVSSGESSEDTTQGIRTPTSSQSESERNEAASGPCETAMVSPIEHAETKTGASTFTNFDQILPAGNPRPDSGSDDETKPILTLHNAKISIFDDSVPGEKSTWKSKPNVDFLVQIEPADARFSGWMIARKYVDFEVLHEVLRRISVITGVRFNETHAALPNYKQLRKPIFRSELEQYLTDAVKFQQLAESEGMKRFLDKDSGLLKSPTTGKGLGWPDPLSMGKGMMDVLAKAPKEVAGGSKALFGGVTNVLGAGKKSSPAAKVPPQRAGSLTSTNDGSVQSPGRQSSDTLNRQLPQGSSSRESIERPSLHKVQDIKSRPSTSSRSSVLSRPSLDIDTAAGPTTVPSASMQNITNLDGVNLPPPPSEIDDFDTPTSGISPRTQVQPNDGITASIDDRSAHDKAEVVPEHSTPAPKPGKRTKESVPLSEQETTVIIDLLFAVISELYTLSSAWTFRRTLLQAARTFLLRPGNPQLESIRVMLQESVIDANSSDQGIARMILKTRENSLPTEEELAAWPKELTREESEALRVKARKLLVERGMPQALTSVMGAAASGEALGKVFDCLQVRSVARSLEFGLMLQALRAIVQ